MHVYIYLDEILNFQMVIMYLQGKKNEYLNSYHILYIYYIKMSLSYSKLSTNLHFKFLY